MIMLRAISWLNSNLPYPILRAWASSEILVTATKRLAFGSRYIRYQRLMEDMESWPIEKIRGWQFRRLSRLLEHSYRNVPFYRELWKKNNVSPEDIRCLDDIKKLPLITREDIKKHGNMFFSRTAKRRQTIVRETSGSSGKAVKVYHDCNTFSATLAKYHYTFGVVGYDGKCAMMQAPLRYREPYLLSNKRPYGTFYSPLTKSLVCSPGIFNQEVFKNYANLIKRLNVRHFIGFPSTCFALARHAKDMKPGIKLDTASLAGESLLYPHRRFIEKTLGCEAFQSYGAKENGIIATECKKHKGMHIFPFTLAEIKNKGLKGEGEIVITNLTNYAFPLIRYDLGDITSITEKECQCGRTFPRVMNLKGKANECIMLPGGGYLHPTSFRSTAIYVRGIDDIYFLQNKDYSLDIYVVKDEKGDAGRIAEGIKRWIGNSSGGKDNGLKYRIRFVKKIRRRNDKRRIVETKVDDYKRGLSTGEKKRKTF